MEVSIGLTHSKNVGVSWRRSVPPHRGQEQDTALDDTSRRETTDLEYAGGVRRTRADSDQPCIDWSESSDIEAFAGWLSGDVPGFISHMAAHKAEVHELARVLQAIGKRDRRLRHAAFSSRDSRCRASREALVHRAPPTAVTSLPSGRRRRCSPTPSRRCAKRALDRSGHLVHSLSSEATVRLLRGLYEWSQPRWTPCADLQRPESAGRCTS
jgi:hypothetical protein